MPDVDIDLPEDWSQRLDTGTDDRVFAAFEHQPTDDTTFLVTIERRPRDPAYALRLSTISPDAEHPRHDYDIAQYDDRDTAIVGAERVLDELDSRLESGDLSPRTPAIEDIHDLLDTFQDQRRVSKLGRLIEYFRDR